MPREVLRRQAQFIVFAQTGMIEVESGVAEAAVELVIFVAEFPGCDGGGNFAESFRIESQCLAHFPRRHAIAVGYDIGGHGCAAPALAGGGMLDKVFSVGAAGAGTVSVCAFCAAVRRKTPVKETHI